MPIACCRPGNDMRCSTLTLICVLGFGGSACSAKRPAGTAAIVGVTHAAVESSQTTRQGDRQKPGVARAGMAGSRQSRPRPDLPRAVQTRSASGSGAPAASHALGTLGSDEELAESATKDPTTPGQAATYGAAPMPATPSPGAGDGDASIARTTLALLAMSTAVVLALVVLMSRRFWRNAG